MFIKYKLNLLGGFVLKSALFFLFVSKAIQLSPIPYLPILKSGFLGPCFSLGCAMSYVLYNHSCVGGLSKAGTFGSQSLERGCSALRLCVL